jgi:uncharacterized iron-regulated membrane protein
MTLLPIFSSDSSITTISRPWYVQTLLLSQSLHFGDYGGLPLKILWLILDLITIVVLGSGLYLWIGRHQRSTARQVEEIKGGGLLEGETQ